MDFLIDSFRNGFTRVRENSQLEYTLFTAGVILIAFVYIAYSFVGIARDVQDELEDVRFASLQDSFVQFAGDHLDTPDVLYEKVTAVAQLNTTIRDFQIIDLRGEQPVIMVSLIPSNVGTQPTNGESLPIMFAELDSVNSIRSEITEDDERMFLIARAIVSDGGVVEAIALIKHTRSAADVAVSNSIRNGVYTFAVVLLVVMILFFRHARIIDYASLYKRLKEVDQLKDDFISMASHELRSPLTVIRGYAEYMDDTKENLTEDQKDFIDKISVSAKYLDSLVADMLDVSRIEQGRMKFEFQKVDPTPTIKEVVDYYMKGAQEKGLSLEYVGEDTRLINVDQGRLKQILINMLSNAVKYTEKGGITVKQYVENNKLIVRISDTGLGMSKEEQDQLFQKFSRVGGVRTKHIRGTGLGLWITKQIVEKMGGTITVESIKGKGSDFILKFPLA